MRKCQELVQALPKNDFERLSNDPEFMNKIDSTTEAG